MLPDLPVFKRSQKPGFLYDDISQLVNTETEFVFS